MPSSASKVFVANVTTKHHSELRSSGLVALFSYDSCLLLVCNAVCNDWWDPPKHYHIYQTACHHITYPL